MAKSKNSQTREEVIKKLFYGVKDIEIILDCSHSKAQEIKNNIEKELIEEGKDLFNRKVPKNYFDQFIKEKYGCVF